MDTAPHDAALYRGTVSHVRLKPFIHRFRYRVFSLAIDLDALPTLGESLSLFSHNRFNLLAVHDRDLGRADGSCPKAWIETCLADAGISAARWRIIWHGFPRLWGFVFNPLSVYFCYDETGQLRAVMHEVRNTFGERHSYLLPVTGQGRVILQRCAKGFHVSPFFPIEGGYRFRLTPPGDRLSILIRYQDSAGEDLLHAAHTGARHALTRAAIIKAVLGHPLMTLKVVAGIHWEALKLWRRGARFHRKPAPPLAPVTMPITLQIAESNDLKGLI